MSIRSLCASVAAHVAAILLVLAGPFPSRSSTLVESQRHVTLIAPSPEPVRARKAKIPPRAMPRPFEGRLTHPAVTMPALALELPAPLLVTATLPSGPSPQLPRVNAPAPVVIAAVESTPVKLKTAPTLELRAAGFSSAEISIREPSRQIAIAAGGFDMAAQPAPGARRGSLGASGFSGGGMPLDAAPARRGKVARGEFGDSSVAAPAVMHHSTEVSGLAPVQITFKPRPAYSAEARSLQIEGEVLLEMLFSASGEACFVRLVQGLGHGLDESAIAAARAIRFRPAQRNGSPVDSPAIVHIVFQLAY